MLPLLSMAEVRSRESAREIAENFFGRAMTKSVTPKLDMVWDGSDVMTRSADQVPAFYVFDNVSGPGFVIVSGDDKVNAVLGYSFESEFDVDDMPPHFIDWMKEIENQVRFASSSSAYSTRAPGSDSPGNVVIQHKTALWNQGSPYNGLCPYDGAVRSVTGCVATAMAIIMKYHEWPDAGEGTLPAYTTSSRGIEVDAIELGYKYDWDNMLMSYDNTSSDVQKEAVARLMADCGAAVMMDYTKSASGADSYFAFLTLAFNMKYDRRIAEIGRGYYSDEQWHKIIQKDLRNNGPVLYAGQSESGGHAFVLDGFTDNQYYHVNWGWGGYYNGFYLLDALGPSDSQIIGGSMSEYNFLQTAIINIFKRNEEDCLVERMALSRFADEYGLQAETDTFEKGVPFRVNTGFIYNIGYSNYSGRVALVVADENNQVKEELWGVDVLDLQPLYGLTYGPTLTYNIDLNIGDRLICVFWNNRTGQWEKVNAHMEGIVDFIPLADQYALGESTSFSFNTKTREIVLITKRGVEVVVTGPSGELVASAVSVQNEPVTIPTADLPAGRYKIALTKNAEYAEFYVVLGTKEDSNE